MDSTILLFCLLSRSSNVLLVHTGLKPFYEEYLELRVRIYEWVRRITFYSCALRGADDENKQRGLINVNIWHHISVSLVCFALPEHFCDLSSLNTIMLVVCSHSAETLLISSVICCFGQTQNFCHLESLAFQCIFNFVPLCIVNDIIIYDVRLCRV